MNIMDPTEWLYHTSELPLHTFINIEDNFLLNQNINNLYY